MREPTAQEIAKTYPLRGPMQQFRLGRVTAFRCFRCGETKTSKLVTIYGGNWAQALCNGCYGRLLSVYEVKAGTQSDDEKVADLSALLLALYGQERTREAERLFRLSEQRADLLAESSLRFVATSEHLSTTLEVADDLDWSPATIGLCKAVEMELTERIVRPLATELRGQVLESDVKDKDLGRVARYCADPGSKPPEIGSFAHFLQTAILSKERRQSSQLLAAFFTLLSTWPDSGWLTSTSGLHESLVKLTREFRNRAAHVDTLTRQDYESCRTFVIGANGLLWRILAASRGRR